MEKFFIRPTVVGARLADPVTRDLLKPEGEWKRRDHHWLRLEMCGDVEVCDPPKAVGVAEDASAAGDGVTGQVEPVPAPALVEDTALVPETVVTSSAKAPDPAVVENASGESREWPDLPVQAVSEIPGPAATAPAT